jgi:hypothetical protein
MQPTRYASKDHQSKHSSVLYSADYAVVATEMQETTDYPLWGCKVTEPEITNYAKATT